MPMFWAGVPGTIAVYMTEIPLLIEFDQKPAPGTTDEARSDLPRPHLPQSLVLNPVAAGRRRTFHSAASGGKDSQTPRVNGVRGAIEFLKRTVRAARIAATDPRIPKPLRWLAALGVAPIPGPFDEALLLIVAVPLAVFYRGPLRDAWERAVVAAS
jgi:hypothetical protein